MELEEIKHDRDMQATLAKTTEKKMKKSIHVRVSSYQKIIITIVPLEPERLNVVQRV